MKTASRIIIFLALIFIVIRIAEPVKQIGITHNVVIEYDPIFSSLSRNNVVRNAQLRAREAGETSVTNILHIGYIIITATGVIFLIEKENKERSSPKENENQEINNI